ncbi:hypothetical protein BE221DRAFT_86093 [Ostreococcus tauri]|uniref:Uncharacterized protein n=1 Tax=Ostreococcus tauri TaxID=70448 RepID=A0A1Y5HY34_OSTTA|nr:hypothetical protein BE221DRAFT_86093 [Ostreococcus tauri]
MHADTTTRDAARETGTSARSAESFDVERSSGDAKPRARFSTLRLIGLNMFFLAYGAWISSFAVVTLPYESTAFFPETDAVALGGFMVIAGASQMSGPLAGYLSDRMRHAHGRRRPLIVKSASVVGPCLVALLAARTYRDDLGDVGGTLAPVMYYVAFAITMIGLNVMYTAATGLVPDLVPDEQMGEANGVLAACSAAGACLSFMWTMLWPDVGNLYFFYIGLLVTCVPITCYCAVEEGRVGVLERASVDVHDLAEQARAEELFLAVRLPDLILHRHFCAGVSAIFASGHRDQRYRRATLWARATAGGGEDFIHRTDWRYALRVSCWVTQRRRRSQALDRIGVHRNHFSVHLVYLRSQALDDSVLIRLLRSRERDVSISRLCFGDRLPPESRERRALARDLGRRQLHRYLHWPDCLLSHSSLLPRRRQIERLRLLPGRLHQDASRGIGVDDHVRRVPIQGGSELARHAQVVVP